MAEEDRGTVAQGSTWRVDAGELRRLVSEVGELCGLPADHVPLFADGLLEADLRGIPSHGVYRLGMYARGFQRGLINPTPQLQEFGSRPASRVLDGDNGLGLIVGQLAMDRSIELAQANGVGAVGVRNSNHSGVLAVHVRRAAARGMIGFFTSNAPALMAPWGSREALISNSPFAYAFPSGQDPVIVDMACSAAARGRIRLAAAATGKIPRGWALDANGNATEDAVAAMRGLVLPMAEHKGSAMAIAFEILAACLSGARLSKDVPRGFLSESADTLDSWGVGHFAVSFDVGAMRPLAEFEAQVDELATAVRSSAPSGAFQEVQMPGDVELRSAKALGATGVNLSEQTVAGLERLRRELGLQSPLTRLPKQEATGV